MNICPECKLEDVKLYVAGLCPSCAGKYITKQAKRIKELEEHLEEFGCHKTSCDYPLEPCNCGFEQALKEK